MNSNQSENNLIIEKILDEKGGKFEFINSSNGLFYKKLHELANSRCKKILALNYENAIRLNEKVNYQLKLNNSLPKYDEPINKRDVILTFEYVKNNLLGASSDLVNNNFGIIIFNFGGVIILNNLFNSLLGYNKTFNFYHFNSEEKYNEPILDKYYDDAFELIKSLGFETYEDLIIKKPKSKIRRKIAFDLLLISFDFLIYHEAAHFTNGHTLYKKKYGGKISGIISQTLEMDADSFSIAKIIDNYLIFPLVHFFQNRTNKSKELFIKSRISLIIYSIGTLLKISSENYLNTNKYSLKTHAKPSHRLIMIMSCFKDYINRFYPQPYLTDSWYNQAFNLIIYEVNHSFEQLTGIKNKDNLFSKKNISESRNLIINLKKCYSEIYNELNEYGYFSITKY